MADIKCFSWGTGPIRIGQGHSLPKRYYELRITELHCKDDGAEGDTPSFCIGMEVPGHLEFHYGQVSFNMLRDAFEQIGYQLTKK